MPTELSSQTASLRSRLQRQDALALEAADAKKQVEQKEAQVSALQAQQLKLQELSQVRGSLRASRAFVLALVKVLVGFT
jgi:hypothetical protein